MKRRLTLILATAATLLATAQVNDLPRTSPEAVGMRSEQVLAFFDSLLAYPRTEIHSVIVMRHGKVVGEMYPAPFRADYCHAQYSCSKAFTAAAVGIAIGENRLLLTDRLVTFFPDQLPNIISWKLASITVKDLLTMRSGFVVDRKMRTQSQHWVKDYLSHPMKASPGKLFQYDSINSYLLSAIIQRVTGMTMLDYLKQRLFSKMNIREVRWEQCPDGITTGGWGLYIQSESLAKFGQLLLQRGNWNGDQLISPRWVDAMMTRHVENAGGDDYGYQMWQCNYPTAFRADGAYGQFIIVVPKEDVVVVITQCTMNSGTKERAYIWNTLFAGMQKTPYKASPAYQDLKQRQYSLPLLDGKKDNKLLNAYIDKTYVLEKNPMGWDSLRFEAPDVMVVSDSRQRKARYELGFHEWKTSSSNLYPPYTNRSSKNSFSNITPPFRCGACYAWSDDQLQVKLHYVNWISSLLMKFSFYGEEMAIEVKENYQNRPFIMVGRLKNEE